MSGGNSEAIITSAVPRTRTLGISDVSQRQVIRDVLPTPDHLPKIFLYCEKGPTEPTLVAPADAATLFGDKTFDERSIFATHQTVLCNQVFKKGNVAMLQRIIPADAPPPSTIRIVADVLFTNIPQYERAFDNTYLLDIFGNKQPTGTFVPGYSVVWKAIQVPLDANGITTFGEGTITEGVRTNANGDTSIVYPIIDLMVSSVGSHGDNKGLRIFVPTNDSETLIKDNIVKNEGAFPFEISCVERPDQFSSAQIVDTINADRSRTVTFKEFSIDTSVDMELYLGDVFIPTWNDDDDPTVAPIVGPFNKIKVYQDNVDKLLHDFVLAEKDYFDDHTDLQSATDSIYLFNMLTGVTSRNAPYYTFEIDNTSIKFNQNYTIWAKGGGDGTMNLTDFSHDVGVKVTEYLDPNSLLQQSAYHCETFIHDSGFALEDKYKLMSFISRRKDTAIVLSTYTVGGRELSVGEESSIGRALSIRAMLYPESVYYGTTTCRAAVFSGYGECKSARYRNLLPLTIEIASKLADYHGASIGNWKEGKSYDDAANNRVRMFKKLRNCFRPANVRETDWNNGVNFVEYFDRADLYWPAMQTVYDNDTSVLNSLKTIVACVSLQRAGQEAQRMFSGNSSLTNAQYANEVVKYINQKIEGRFDGAYVIVPETFYTAQDIARGYSYTTKIKIYAPNMKTVQTLTVEAHRLTDLETTTAV